MCMCMNVLMITCHSVGDILLGFICRIVSHLFIYSKLRIISSLFSPPTSASALRWRLAPAQLGARVVSMELVTVIILAVGGTTLPLFLDMLRTFVPQRLHYGRLVAAWHRQVLMYSHI